MRKPFSHPVSYAQHCPFAHELQRLSRDPHYAERVLASHRQYTGSEFDRTRAIGLLYLDCLEPFTTNGLLPEGPDTNLWIMQEHSTAQMYTLFCGAGRMIFEFSEDLTEAFLRSDLGEAHVSDIRLPYPALYLRFNSTEPILFDGRRALDGCYVFLGKDSRFIGLMLAGVRQDTWPDIGDIGYQASIDLSNPNSLLSDAVAQAYELQMRQFAEMDEQAARERGIQSENIEKPQERLFAKAHESMMELLRLVGNALLFLSAYPDEVEEGWTEGAPRELVEITERGRPKQRRETFDELWQMGYTKVRYCGRSSQMHTQQLDAPTPGKLSRHWRRGHWRRQPHGPGLRERKLIWIRPVLVGSGPETAPGHVYEVR